MDWLGGRRSDNVEDERGSGMGRPLLMGGGVVSVIGGILFYLLTGQSPPVGPEDSHQRPMATAPARHGPAQGSSAQEGTTEDFVSVVLASTEDTWPRILRSQGVRYVRPKLVLFTNAVRSACGFAESAVGPFYCPPDSKVYLDMGFFRELRRLGGPGDFAEAYVIAHEVGHHVQNLLGISDQVMELRRRNRAHANALSVLTELQADCYAGLWAHHANDQRRLLEPGDTEQGLAAAAAIGDDRLQKRGQGYVAPESFTHGSSKQRVEWFRRGLSTGTLESCDTFSSAGVRLSRQ